MPASTPAAQPPSPAPVTGGDSVARANASAATEAAGERLEEEQPDSSTAAAASASGQTGAPSNAIRADVAWLKENWGRVLQAIRPRSRVVEALLKSCEPVSVQGDTVTVGFYHGFHKDRMNEDKNRLVVEEALAEVAGERYLVKFVLYSGNRPEREQQATADRREELLQNPVVREAIKEFGAQVVDVQ